MDLELPDVVVTQGTLDTVYEGIRLRVNQILESGGESRSAYDTDRRRLVDILFYIENYSHALNSYEDYELFVRLTTDIRKIDLILEAPKVYRCCVLPTFSEIEDGLWFHEHHFTQDEMEVIKDCLMPLRILEL